MRKSRFIKHLEQLTEEELREEMMLLYDKVDDVKTFYSMELGTADERVKLYDRAKKDITSKYATKSYRKPRRPRIQKINKILADMKKKSVFSHEILDLYLFDVETAITFMREYDFFSLVLAKHIIKVYEMAIRIIQDLKLESEFEERCSKILASTYFSPGIHIDLEDLYDECFG